MWMLMRYLIILNLIFCVELSAVDNKVSIQNELQKNNKIIYQKKKQEKSLLKELGHLRKNIYLTQKKLNRAYRKYNSYHQQIKDTENKLKQEKIVLKQTKAYLNQKIISLHKEQNRPVIQLIFNSSSFSNLLNNMYLYEKVIESDFYEMEAAKQKIDAFRTNKKKLEFSKYKASSLKKSILKQRYALKHTKNRYQKNLTSLRTELKQFEERNRVLREESEQLGLYIKNKSSINNLKQYYGSGKYLRPVGGYISSRFGLRRHPIFKRRRMHTGMDFAAPRGYRIKATDSGQVLFSGFKKGYGNVTIINHGWQKNKRISSLYAHQWKILVRKGQFVKKGQLIGYVGSTGYSTGPHLHFEIRENGNPVNPSRYLRL